MPTNTLKSSAPGSYLGYSLQSTRMCLHLCKAPRGSVVALEVLDDTDALMPDGSAMLEQSKSGLVSNPISNWSIDLWKTFANWIDAVESGAVDLDITHFRLYILQKKEGAYAYALSFAHTEAQVKEVVEEIRLAYLEEKPGGCKVYIEKFLDYDPQKLSKLVISFELECGNSQLIEGIKDCLSLTIPDELLHDACVAALGWVKDVSDSLIANNQYPAIARSQFTDWLSTFTSRFSFNHVLKYTLPKPTLDEIEQGIPNALVMMRQLELIEVKGDEFTEAMSDYLQAKANKVQWAARGIVFDGEFDEFTKVLKSKWKAFGKEIKLLHGSASDVDRGQLLHLKCMAATAKLNDVDSPEFFIRGTYHDCSNKKILGWHPEYLKLLSCSSLFGPSSADAGQVDSVDGDPVNIY